MKQFIVVTEGGFSTFASPDPHEALAFARQDGSPVQWLAPSEAELAAMTPLRMANPKGRRLKSYETYPQEMRPLFGDASNAMRMSSLPVIPESVMDMDIERAYAAILPIFKEANAASVRETVASGKTAKSGTVALGLAGWTQPGGWLGENAKLAKRDEATPGVALGLALLPEYSAFTLTSAAGVSLHDVRAPHPAAGLHATRSGLVTSTFCVGSTPECRAGCLVNAGQNASAIRANYVKFAKAKALLERPYEFMRILGEACAKYEQNSNIVGGDLSIPKFLRLNVLSDIPWEEVAPWIFTRFPGLTPYDYTKVANRQNPSNYNLSFSYSGGNQEACERELRRGRNIVQVYVAPEYVIKQNIARYAKDVAPARIQKALAKIKGTQKGGGKAKEQADKIALLTWLNINRLPTEAPIGVNGTVLPVVDGDRTDFRPYDEKGVIVGLRWKSAKVFDRETGRRAEKSFSQLPKKFILYGNVVDTKDGPVYVLGETPSSSGINAGDKDAAAKVALRAASDALLDQGAEHHRRARIGAIKDDAASRWRVL